MLRRLTRFIIRLLFRSLSRLKVIGMENLPGEGQACILAINHNSRLDGPLIFALVDRPDITGLVTTKYQKNAFIAWLAKVSQAIWINREELDMTALKASLEYLKKGGALGIAPEGTRSHTGSLLEAKTGVAYLAEKSGAPMVPIGIAGTHRALPSLLHFRREKIVVHFGEPFHLPPIDRRNRTEGLERNTDLIIIAIARLVPASYHGVYAEKVIKAGEQESPAPQPEKEKAG